MNTRINEHLQNLKHKELEKLAMIKHRWIFKKRIIKRTELLKMNSALTLTSWRNIIFIFKNANTANNFEILWEIYLIKLFFNPVPG
jgi:hypothetical protein